MSRLAAGRAVGPCNPRDRGRNMDSNSTRSSSESTVPLNVDAAVKQRYAAAARQAEPALCCPIDYDRQYLEVLPSELIERDYGCGDPSRYVRPGETVLDLGSGGGKICYIASQVVGPEGRVIGVDCNDEMLTLARQFQDEVSENIGHRNVEFRKGRIQDLALDLEAFEGYLAEHPIQTSADWLDAQSAADLQRRQSPLIADNSIDVIVSNCVLNLVSERDRRQLFEEMFRVLKPGGRAVISDITCDEPPPEELKSDPQLWSGCISGAFVEDEFLQAFERAGFYGVEILVRQEKPWAVIGGIEFRSVTVQAFRSDDGPCLDYRQAVIYRGPWKSVTDEAGHVFHRGIRTAVCKQRFGIYTRAPYLADMLPIQPTQPVADEAAQPMDCRQGQVRTPRETKGAAVGLTLMPGEGDCCGDSGCC